MSERFLHLGGVKTGRQFEIDTKLIQGFSDILPWWINIFGSTIMYRGWEKTGDSCIFEERDRDYKEFWGVVPGN